MRTVPVWAFKQHAVVISYLRFGTTYRSHLQGLRIQELRNGPEECSSHLLRVVSLKTQQSLFVWRPGQRRRYSDWPQDRNFGDLIF
jgi:hypothetical protein